MRHEGALVRPAAYVTEFAHPARRHRGRILLLPSSCGLGDRGQGVYANPVTLPQRHP